MLSRFSNEVLSRGSSAVLPQSLTDFWLEMLQKLSDDFLDSNFTTDQCSETLETGDPILVACVHEILRYNRSADSEISAGELAENVTIYALSITMETIRRESDMEMTLPTLKNLLSIGRIVQFGKINPDFGRFLERACIVPDNETPAKEKWFQRLKKKIRTRIAQS
jgi:late competence protein required for DNA uptake (superfamily II DNA/RNA helicase)